MDLKCHGKGFGITLDSGELGKCLTQRSMIQLSFKKEHLDSITDHGFEVKNCYAIFHGIHVYRNSEPTILLKSWFLKSKYFVLLSLPVNTTLIIFQDNSPLIFLLCPSLFFLLGVTPISLFSLQCMDQHFSCTLTNTSDSLCPWPWAQPFCQSLVEDIQPNALVLWLWIIFMKVMWLGYLHAESSLLSSSPSIPS